MSSLQADVSGGNHAPPKLHILEMEPLEAGQGRVTIIPAAVTGHTIRLPLTTVNLLSQKATTVQY